MALTYLNGQRDFIVVGAGSPTNESRFVSGLESESESDELSTTIEGLNFLICGSIEASHGCNFEAHVGFDLWE
jgi:hypothetical protein